jgi:hypothetical protein
VSLGRCQTIRNGRFVTDERDRTRLEKTVGEAVPGLPPIEWAAEAFVRFAPGVPEGLRDWRALAYVTPGPLTLD